MFGGSRMEERRAARHVNMRQVCVQGSLRGFFSFSYLIYYQGSPSILIAGSEQKLKVAHTCE